MHGRTIRIHLVDGAPTGTLTAEIMNWTGHALVFPRAKLADVAKRTEVRRTGLYCLVGPAPESPSRESVYFGEADNVVSRLGIHNNDEARDFWTRTVVFVSKDENLTKAHARYLESRLIELARQAGRAVVANATSPPRPPLPEADIADMEYFLEQIELMLPVLGFSFLQGAPEPSEVAERADSPLFTIAGVGVTAEAREIDGEFVVLKGSTARRKGVDSWSSGRAARDALIEEGKLVEGDDPETLVFAQNVAFSSPSTAASIVLGRNVNGRLEWKLYDSGHAYRDWQASRLRSVGVDDHPDEA
jgi:hypothetical protein